MNDQNHVQDNAWREIVVSAMMACIEWAKSATDAEIVTCLVRSGFSLADIRGHWEEIKRRRS
jgi:hypothetical protein